MSFLNSSFHCLLCNNKRIYILKNRIWEIKYERWNMRDKIWEIKYALAAYADILTLI